MAFDLGDLVPLSFDITDAAGVPANASLVTLTITRRGSTTAEPGTGVLGNPQAGRYTFDFVPTVAGLYDVVWRSAGPAAAFDDVIDVRAPTGGVISLGDARAYLNKLGGTAADEDELRTMLAAAVERVDRHLYSRAERDSGRTLAAEPVISESQVLAVKMVLAEFWRTQRARLGGRGAGMAAAAAAIDSDAGPAGTAPLTVRLADLLGPPLGADAGGVPQPVGSFPPACGWPDPADQVTWGRW